MRAQSMLLAWAAALALPPGAFAVRSTTGQDQEDEESAQSLLERNDPRRSGLGDATNLCEWTSALADAIENKVSPPLIAGEPNNKAAAEELGQILGDGKSLEKLRNFCGACGGDDIPGFSEFNEMRLLEAHIRSLLMFVQHSLEMDRPDGARAGLEELANLLPKLRQAAQCHGGDGSGGAAAPGGAGAAAEDAAPAATPAASVSTSLSAWASSVGRALQEKVIPALEAEDGCLKASEEFRPIWDQDSTMRMLDDACDQPGGYGPSCQVMMNVRGWIGLLQASLALGEAERARVAAKELSMALLLARRVAETGGPLRKPGEQVGGAKPRNASRVGACDQAPGLSEWTVDVASALSSQVRPLIVSKECCPLAGSVLRTLLLGIDFFENLETYCRPLGGAQPTSEVCKLKVRIGQLTGQLQGFLEGRHYVDARNSLDELTRVVLPEMYRLSVQTQASESLESLLHRFRHLAPLSERTLGSATSLKDWTSILHEVLQNKVAPSLAEDKNCGAARAALKWALQGDEQLHIFEYTCKLHNGCAAFGEVSQLKLRITAQLGMLQASLDCKSAPGALSSAKELQKLVLQLNRLATCEVGQARAHAVALAAREANASLASARTLKDATTLCEWAEIFVQGLEVQILPKFGKTMGCKKAALVFRNIWQSEEHLQIVKLLCLSEARETLEHAAEIVSSATFLQALLEHNRAKSAATTAQDLRDQLLELKRLAEC